MSWKQYGHVVLIGASSAFGMIIASLIGGTSLGATHVIVGCIITALITAKTLTVSFKAADSKR